MPSSQNPHSPTRRNGSIARSSSGRKPRSTAQQEDGETGSEIQERVEEWVQERVDERPWTMVGAAAGIGLAIGALSRPAQASNIGRMLTATASGVAVRLAINTLVEWLGAQQPSAESEPRRAAH